MLRHRRREPVATMLRQRQGVVAIEFALVGPSFLLLVCMTLQLALQLFVQATLDYGIDAAARQVQIGTIRDADGNARAEFRAAVCGYVPSFTGSCLSLLQTYAVTGPAYAALPRATPVAGMLTPSTFSVGTAKSLVLIQVAYQMPNLIPWVGQVAGGAPGLLMATAALQNEPY